jgi:flavin reductase (DIM6/NTAB) family NADH-FMN oxidoreductase RutF
MSAPHTIDQVSPFAFRAASRSFATGVTIVTTAGHQGPSAATANAFTTLSLTPPLVLVCLGSGSATLRAIERNGLFAVNVLSAEQEWLARRFASRSRARGPASLRDVPHRAGPTGAPLLDGTACWIDCRLAAAHPAGDHVIAIGRVAGLGETPDVDPLVFHAGRYRAVSDRDTESIAALTNLHPLRPQLSQREEVKLHEDVLCSQARDSEDHGGAVRPDVHPPSRGPCLAPTDPPSPHQFA